ncbi:Efflux pump periplasmic linker BepD [compost metagenome]
MRAIFSNGDHLLVPGQIVAVTLLDDSAIDLPIIPMSAVLQDRQGRYVFVLNADNTVSRRPIVTGARIGNNWAVADGLKAGETIVVEGLQRITDGQSVEPHDRIAGEVGAGQ